MGGRLGDCGGGRLGGRLGDLGEADWETWGRQAGRPGGGGLGGRLGGRLGDLGEADWESCRLLISV